jgi:IPT/TIG domain-containing protein
MISICAFARAGLPEITSISPTSGPEGTKVEITGENLAGATTVVFGATPANFKAISPQEIVALVPHNVSTSTITVGITHGDSFSPFPFVVCNDPRVPEEVSYKAGYVNAVPRPADFTCARLGGIAIADTPVPGHQAAQVEIAWTKFSCRIGGKDFVLNDDLGHINGGLYVRHPLVRRSRLPRVYAEPLQRSSACHGDPRGRRSHLALLESLAEGGASVWRARRMHGQSSCQDFPWRFAANWI